PISLTLLCYFACTRLLPGSPLFPYTTLFRSLTVGRVSGVVSTYLGANGRGVWVKGDVSTWANGGEFFNERGDLVGVQGGAHRGVGDAVVGLAGSDSVQATGANTSVATGAGNYAGAIAAVEDKPGEVRVGVNLDGGVGVDVGGGINEGGW